MLNIMSITYWSVPPLIEIDILLDTLAFAHLFRPHSLGSRRYQDEERYPRLNVSSAVPIDTACHAVFATRSAH